MSSCPEIEFMAYGPMSRPALVPRSIFEMTYGGDTITFPAPSFGDREQRLPYRIERETIKREFISFDLTLRTRIFRFQFDEVDKGETDDYLDFIRTSLGQPITVVDHNTITWTALIIEPEVPVAYFGEDTECRTVTEVALRWLS